MIGLYLPGTSWLHRAPVGGKLVLLMLSAIVVLNLRVPSAIGVAAAILVALFALARIPWRTGFSQLVPILWLAVPLFVLQWFMAGPARATVVVGQLLILVGLAALVTLTSRVTAMLDAFETGLRPLRRFGVDPERIALVLALTIRCLPLVAQVYAETREARRARGLDGSPLALAVPLVIRLLKKADRIGEGLAARGCDD